MDDIIKHVTYGCTTLFFSMVVVFFLTALLERPLFPVEQLEPRLEEGSFEK
jgi:hypothetical protein